MKLKNKLIIAGSVFVVVCLIVSHVAIYYKGWNDAERRAVPTALDKDPVVTPVAGKPATISITNLMYHEDALTFLMLSTGAGAGEAWIRRPERWIYTPPKNIFMLGLGGGYHCGYWLPGGTAAYLRRVGGLGKYNFYLGPELGISALNARDVAVEIFGKASMTW